MATATPKAVAPDPEEVVADEGPRRTPAAIAAILAGLLTIGVSIYSGLLAADRPAVSVVETLAPLVNTGEPPAVSPRVAILQFEVDTAFDQVLGSVLRALGLLTAGFALRFLIRAARHRKPDIPAFLPTAILLGALVLGVVTVIVALLRLSDASDFLAAEDRSPAAFEELGSGLPPGPVSSVLLFALFVLAFGYVYGALNAMRVGLLTRFMGVLGIIVGAALIIGSLLPFAGSGFPLVQAFWLIGLGLIYLDRWPGGVPPAWSAGEARPWPTQLELREARDRERLERDGHAPSDEPEPEPEPERTREPLDAPGATQPHAPTRTHSSSKKRKRKRR
ncbi:MAG: DUF3784 domain-containing protein [Solirubrobacteraceae bacterium MAG38_C4-C5]|nr:DUF3784 domain-containing protein [Candidatus Siliceabacter maunaloa]